MALPGPAGTAREELHPEVVRAAVEAEAISTPSAVSRALEVRETTRGEVALGNRIAIKGKRLPHLFEGAEGGLFIVATAGPAIEARAFAVPRLRRPCRRYDARRRGNRHRRKTLEQTLAHLIWRLQLEGHEVGPSISPGSESWALEGQRVIFEVLPTAEIGVTLLDSMMMSPKKTQSLVCAFGRELRVTRDPDSTMCRTCRAKRCPMRLEDYEGPLGG